MTRFINLFAVAVLIGGVPQVASTQEAVHDLAGLRAAARSQHPSITSAEAAIEAAESFRTQQRLLLDPVIRFEAGHAESGGLSATEWQGEVVQRVPLPGHRRWRTRLADARLETARHGRHSLEAMIDYEVGRLWADALLAARSADVAVQGEAIAYRLLTLIERRAEVGEASRLEVLKARTEWFTRRQLSLEANRDLSTGKKTLDIFCNGSLGPEFELEGELDSPVALLPSEQLLAQALEANPRAQSRRATIDEAEALSQVERHAALPGLALSISWESEIDKDATSVGILFALPLWNRNRAAVAIAEAEVRNEQARLLATLRELETELETAVAAYRAAAETLALYEEGWRSTARDAAGIATFSFENGESSLLELLDTQRSLLDVGLGEAQARARLTQARLRIEYLTGQPLKKEPTNEAR